MEFNIFDFSFKKDISTKYLKNRLKNIFAVLKEKNDISLSIVLVSEKTMKNLNALWRQKNEITTVLTFCDENENVLSWKGKELKERHLGDIFLCLKQIKQKAKKHHLTYLKYLDSILIHGVLHLYGYSHDKESSKRIMEQKEKTFLKTF